MWARAATSSRRRPGARRRRPVGSPRSSGRNAARRRRRKSASPSRSIPEVCNSGGAYPGTACPPTRRALLHPGPRGHHGDMTNSLPGGTFQLAPDITVNRVGYGAMQLAGPHVFGPPADRDEAVRVLREALALGIDHIDTSDFYGPHVTNEIIKEPPPPSPGRLTIVTRVGPRRDADGGWPHARSPEELRAAVHDNLTNL